MKGNYLKEWERSERIILKYIVEIWVVRMQTGLKWLRIGSNGGL